MAMSKKEKMNYRRKYNEEKYARIGLYLLPEDKGKWEREAKSQGVSLSEFIKRCVNEEISRDQERL